MFVWSMSGLIWDFKNCPLNTGYPLNAWPLNRGLTVFPNAHLQTDSCVCVVTVTVNLPWRDFTDLHPKCS